MALGRPQRSADAGDASCQRGAVAACSVPAGARDTEYGGGRGDAVRRAELARRYLAREKRGIDEVAHLLGFSEPSAFTKAFRRWTGQTPADFVRAGSE